MEVNGDFSQRVIVHSDDLEWRNSPMPGVQRRRLDRVYAEDEKVTTVVRYAPGSHFSPHVHTGGEEFIVLEGVFQDEHGDYPTGTYVRNPPTSSHTPGSEPGCIIMVKLWQFDPDDRTHIRIDTNRIGSVDAVGRRGVQVSPLFQDDREEVRFEKWSAGADVSLDTSGGAELFVLAGSFEESGDTLRENSWLRVPIGGDFQAKAGPEGARVWLKTGHIRFS